MLFLHPETIPDFLVLLVSGIVTLVVYVYVRTLTKNHS
jgi:hypothetical protein